MSSILGPFNHNSSSHHPSNQQSLNNSTYENQNQNQQHQQPPRMNFIAPPGMNFGGNNNNNNNNQQQQPLMRPPSSSMPQNYNNNNQQQQQSSSSSTARNAEQSPAPSHPQQQQGDNNNNQHQNQSQQQQTRPAVSFIDYHSDGNGNTVNINNNNQNQQQQQQAPINYTQQAMQALREQNLELEQKKQFLQQQQSSGNNSNNQNQKQLHIPSEVLFANERPGMRPIPDSAFMISGYDNNNNNDDYHPGGSHHHHNNRKNSASPHRGRSYSVEAAQQQANSILSPFTQRLAKKMNQTIQFEKMQDHPAATTSYDEYGNEQHIDPHMFLESMNGGGDQHGFHQQQSSVLGPLRGGSVTSTRGTHTPGRTGRGVSPSLIRSRYSQSLGRSVSGSTTASTRMRIGNFVVQFPEATGELSRRIQMGTAARRDEINRRQLTKLHRPTAAGILNNNSTFSTYRQGGDIEPLPQEPGHTDSIYRKPAALIHTTSVTRSRTPLRTMTRQDWEDNRRQQAFSQELRRHSAEVSKRSMSRNAAPYVNKHRGVDHTYLSEGAKWFTTPSPRIGIPCKITIASNEHGVSPGPGSYHTPSSFLGR